jgi:hypothetical protein
MSKYNRAHGATSIILFFVALGIPLYFVFADSLGYGLIYVALILLGTVGIVYSFCCKCCSKHACSHIILGWLARHFVTRPVGKYTASDVILMAASFAVMVGFPQVWLWQNTGFAILFWVLIVIVVWEIATSVCPKCQNTLCPFHPKMG